MEAYARRLGALLVGEDPIMVGKLWEKMFRADRGIRRVGIAGYAVAALDIALWDIAGKAANQPLARALGGGHRSRSSLRQWRVGHLHGRRSHRRGKALR